MDVSLGDQVLSNDLTVQGLGVRGLCSDGQALPKLLQLKVGTSLSVGVELAGQVEGLVVIDDLARSDGSLPCWNAGELSLVLE